MLLRDGVIDVRDYLGDYTERVWQLRTIIRQLNISAKRMCAAAQNIHEYDQPPVTANQQEIALKLKAQVLTQVKYFNGTLFDLKYIAQRRVQTGGKQGGTPVAFYVRTGVKTLTGQGSTGDIVPIETFGQQEYTALGLYPIPITGGNLRVWYVAEHPWVDKPEDRVQIPDEYVNGWTAYAKARLVENRKGAQEADRLDAIHEKEMERFRIAECWGHQATNLHSYESPSEYAGISTEASSVILLGGNITLFNENLV